MRDLVLDLVEKMLTQNEGVSKLNPYHKFTFDEPTKNIDLYFNINTVTENYLDREFIFKNALIFLEREMQRVDSYIQSKQSSDDLHSQLVKKIERIKWLLPLLEKAQFRNSKFYKMHIKNRRFLPIFPVSYSDHKNRSEAFEHAVYFLGNSYTKKTKDNERFEMVLFDEDDYALFQKIISGATSPNHLVKQLSKLTNTPKEKITLVRFSPVFGGFAFYCDHLDLNSSTRLKEIQSKNNDLLYYDQPNNQWILYPESISIHLYEIIDMFDLWVDIDANVCNTKYSRLPLKLNEEIKPPTLHPKVDFGIYFSYTPTFIELKQSQIIQAILMKHPYRHIKVIEILNQQYQSIATESIWTCAEILCVRFNQTKDNYMVAIYNTANEEVVMILDSLDLITNSIERVVQANYDILNINSYEIEKPRKLA